MRTKINQLGLELLEKSEGLRLKAYKCSAGRWTIGYGHTGPDVGPNSTITEPHAQELLNDDLGEAINAVNRLVKVVLTSNQFSALVCFVYNVGAGAFEKSTMRRLLNEGSYSGAAKEFLRWDKVKGQPVAGLTVRRRAEKALFEA
jgi:lysozyme